MIYHVLMSTHPPCRWSGGQSAPERNIKMVQYFYYVGEEADMIVKDDNGKAYTLDASAFPAAAKALHDRIFDADREPKRGNPIASLFVEMAAIKYAASKIIDIAAETNEGWEASDATVEDLIPESTFVLHHMIAEI